MADVLPFDAPIATPTTGLVGADGKKVNTPRQMQNDIIQRRNFVLLDMMTGEMMVSNGNGIMAMQALKHSLVELELQVMKGISQIEALNVFKKGVEAAPAETPVEAVAEATSSTACEMDVPPNA